MNRRKHLDEWLAEFFHLSEESIIAASEGN